MSKPETWSLIEIYPKTNADVDLLLGGSKPRRLIVRHFFPDARNHKLIAAGSKDACFAALRLMEQGPFLGDAR